MIFSKEVLYIIDATIQLSAERTTYFQTEISIGGQKIENYLSTHIQNVMYSIPIGTCKTFLFSQNCPFKETVGNNVQPDGLQVSFT